MPRVRPRDQRADAATRDRLADVALRPSDLVCPLFVRPGRSLDQPVESMPGVSQLSPDVAARRIDALSRRGLGRFILFGVVEPERKDDRGSAAFDPDNPVNQTLRRVREAGTEAQLIADLCFCEYTSHGHCGVLADGAGGGEPTVDNDATLELLARQAVVLAEHGADVVAPSGMMDGQVGAVRAGLNASGQESVEILSYTIKYASSLYGPFREAGEGAPRFGDRRTYQMDYRRREEWRLELALDLEEGADAVMVKPALAYLDVIRGVREATDRPVAGYHVSGEYSMVHAAAARGWCDLRATALEHTIAIRRAGADRVVTYFAPRLLEWIDSAPGR